MNIHHQECLSGYALHVHASDNEDNQSQNDSDDEHGLISVHVSTSVFNRDCHILIQSNGNNARNLTMGENIFLHIETEQRYQSVQQAGQIQFYFFN